MKTLIYGAGPIGQWLALSLQKAAIDVTLLARGKTLGALDQKGVCFFDAVSKEHRSARVKLVDKLGPEDKYELVIVPMIKSSRLAICPILAANKHIDSILFLGNEVAGPMEYFKHLPDEKVLLGFPGAGGGWKEGVLTIADRDKPKGKGQIWIGELNGKSRQRTRRIKELFESANIKTSIEKDMDGWLKYHFAFMGPTAGVIFRFNGDLKAVASSSEAIHQYCAACREIGDILAKNGYTKRQPAIFNMYYWLPHWLEPKIFSKLFGAEDTEVKFGLHAHAVGPELLDLAEEFQVLKARSSLETPHFDALLDHIREKTTQLSKKLTDGAIVSFPLAK